VTRELITQFISGRLNKAEFDYEIGERWENYLAHCDELFEPEKIIASKVRGFLRRPHTLLTLKRKLLPFVVVRT